MLARLWRRWRQWCERRQQVWPVPSKAALAQQEYRKLCREHGAASLYACVNGDAAIFMGPAHYEAIDYLQEKLRT